MDAQPPVQRFAGFPPIDPLIASLITVSYEISSISNLPPIQVKNIIAMTRKIRLLSPLFSEVQEQNILLLPSAILCFTELLSLMTRVKLLIQGCADGSYLWSLLQTEVLSEEFNTILKEIGKALDILPLKSMNITSDIRELVELLHNQAKKIVLLVDHKELAKREVILQILSKSKEKNDNNYHFLDVGRARGVLSSIGLKSSIDYAEEISKLKREATSQGGTGGPIVVSKIFCLISLLTYVRSMIFSFEESETTIELLKNKTTAKKLAPSQTSQAILSDVPREFQCPLSHEIMREPVTIATGHTYDRNSISKWINSGRKTCPSSGWKLTHFALIPNYNLKSLIHQWHQENNIPLNENNESFSELQTGTQMGNYGINAVKLTSEFLVGKLATASSEMQSRAAYETRLLAKISMESRKIIAEAGAIPFLVNLLNSPQADMQVNAVTALLNISINKNNKNLIMEAGSLLKTVEVLESGKSMKARENAAALISSLSIMEYYKISIGAQPRVIAALIRLLREGTPTGKKDATIALTNLAFYNPNKRSLVHEGVVPLLIDVLIDDKAGITDDVLGLLALLSGCSEGIEEITRTKSKHLMPLLIDLLKYGSTKGKEISLVLLALCKDGAEVVRQLDAQTFSLLQNLKARGSPEAQERSSRLHRLLIKCCSNPANF